MYKGDTVALYSSFGGVDSGVTIISIPHVSESGKWRQNPASRLIGVRVAAH